MIDVSLKASFVVASVVIFRFTSKDGLPEE
jgi:hypothetical protein